MQIVWYKYVYVIHSYFLNITCLVNKPQKFEQLHTYLVNNCHTQCHFRYGIT